MDLFLLACIQVNACLLQTFLYTESKSANVFPSNNNTANSVVYMAYYIQKRLKVVHCSTLQPKLVIHYAVFALISPWFYSLNKLTLVEESQSQSADYSWQIPQKIL